MYKLDFDGLGRAAVQVQSDLIWIWWASCGIEILPGEVSFLHVA